MPYFLSPNPPSSTTQQPPLSRRPHSSNSGRTEGLDDLLDEAIWYEDFQNGFSDILQDAVQETEGEIRRAHRSLLVTHREQRDGVNILKARESAKRDENEIEKLREQLARVEQNVQDLEALIERLEKRLRSERRMLTEVNGEA